MVMGLNPPGRKQIKKTAALTARNSGFPICTPFMLIPGKPEIRAQFLSFNFPNNLI